MGTTTRTTASPGPRGLRSRLPRLPAWARRGGLVLVTALIVEYLVVPQLAGARAALRVLSQVSLRFLLVGCLLEAASLACYSALTRAVLPARYRPRWTTLLRIDLSALGLSHVVPAGGAAATALRYRFLVLTGVPPGVAVPAIAIEGTGVALVLVLLFVCGLLFALPSAYDNPVFVVAGLFSALVILVAAVASGAVLRRPAPVRSAARAIARVVPGVRPETAARAVDVLADRLRLMAGDPRLVATTLMWACGNWLFDAASLGVFLRAFGTHTGLEGLLLGYGVASVLALLPVSPAGLGLVEGTLVPVLVGFGAPHPEALLGVIAWRLLEFWLPIPLAAGCYLSLRTGVLRQRRLPARPLIPRPEPSMPSPSESLTGVSISSRDRPR